MEETKNKKYLPKIIGKGYATFWKSKKRYLVVKGSRASKKSKTTALKLIYNIMKYPKSNGLIVRKVHRTLKDSCYSELEWAINTLGVADKWSCKASPIMEFTYLPTNQKILFRGMDDPLKLTSITVSVGVLNFVWIEEAFEISKEEDFDKLDLSIRGQLPEGYFKQIILTFNAWSDRHWLKSRFFDNENEDIEALTTNYLKNEFLGVDDLKVFEKMKKDNPRRYAVEGLGEWGVMEGLIYENWLEYDFDYKELIKNDDFEFRIGLDFGFTTDPVAIIMLLINEKDKEIYIFDEVYKKHLTNDKIANEIKNRFYQKELIIADSAEQKSIEELKRYGLTRIRPAIKGQGSIMYGIKKVNEYKLYIHSRCVNTLTEISSYTYDNKTGKPIDLNNHLLDALRYAVAQNTKQKGIVNGRKIITIQGD